MSLEPGGLSEKIGNRYESSWVTYQLLSLLDEKISYVQVEPIGTDEDAVDVIIGHFDNSREHHQCKIGNRSDEAWTLATLQSKELLTKGFQHILSGTKAYKVVSRIGFRLLEDICESARNSTGSSSDFFKYQIKDISPDRLKLFNELCRRLGLDPSTPDALDKAFQFFKTFKIEQFKENNLDNELCSLIAAKLVHQPSSQLIHFLQTYPVKCNRLRAPITAHILKRDLEAHQFSFKTYPGDPHISSVIKTLNEEFDHSIEPFLISQQNISRIELTTALDIINASPITLIKADAGVGKSAFLLDLKKHFVQSGAIVLPIRLDRRVPQKNINQFGEELGFPYSPVSCLAKYGKGQEIVVILDQLDALRWTAHHSSNALDICIQMVTQILSLRKHSNTNIKIIMAIRNFDLEDDVRFKNWISSLDDVQKLELKLLEPDQIKPYVDQYENYDQLNEEQKNILKIPLWLGIYIELANNLGQAPQFTNKLGLIKSFIESRFKLLRDHHAVPIQHSEKFFNEIVNLMNQSSKLSIATNLLSNGSTEMVKSMISVGLLFLQNRDISFRHQAIYDYEIGKKLYMLGLSSPKEFLKELGEVSQQTLLKREHLRYALAMLYESDERAFCSCTEALLYNDEIRFHLKSLVFNTLRHIKNFKTPLKRLIYKIFIDTDLAPHFIRLSCSGSPTLIQYLSDSQHLSMWLDTDGKQQSQGLQLLKTIAEKSPDLLINELSKFINKSEEWNQKIYNCLCWNMADDSDDLFNFRLEVIKSGVKIDYIFWDDLTKQHPIRAIELLELMCDEDSHNRLNARGRWVDHDTECIEPLALSHPQQILEKFLPFLNQYFSIIECDPYKWSHEYASRTSFEMFIYKGVFTIVTKASENMVSKPIELFQLLNPFTQNSNLVFNRIFANTLINLHTSYADDVIHWLLESPKQKFKLGNDFEEPVWVLASKLIEKFSPYCSEEYFKQIEETIYCFSSDYDLEQIKWRLQGTRQNYYNPFWGKTQYFLLPKLDSSRISDKSKQLIVVLNRKFEKYTENDFCHRSNTVAGFITSPIKNKSQLSNKAWKKLVLTNPSNFQERKFRMDLTEASIHQFSNNFRDAVTAEPQRFAKFALTLPISIPQDFIDALYEGLSESDLSRVPDHLKENWKPCPIDLIEQLINHFPTENYSISLGRLLSAKITQLSLPYVDLLETIAYQANDPQPNKLNIHTVGHPDTLDKISSDDLFSNTLNCTRGSAYRSIAQKFWDDQEYALSHKYIIESALNDEHAAVRMATADLLLPMYNYDRHYAFEKFLELCQKDIRNTLSQGRHYYFNNAFSSKFKDSFINLVRTMLISDYPDVRKEGHKQVIARWLFDGLFEEELHQATTSKSIESLLSYASVMNELLGGNTQDYDENKMKPLFDLVVNADNDETLKKMGRFFNQNFWSKQYSRGNAPCK